MNNVVRRLTCSVLCLFLGAHLVFSQEDIIRLGVLQLPYKSINIGYEHPFNRNFSMNLTTNVQLPLSFDEGLFGNIIDRFNREWEVGEFRPGVELSGFDITPEARWYPNGTSGKRAKSPEGFFFSVLLKYSRYNWNLPYHWVDDNPIELEYNGTVYNIPRGTVEADIDTEANTHAFAGGLGIGGQWLVNRARTIAIGVDASLGWGGAWREGTMTILTETVTLADQSLEEQLGEDGINALINRYAEDIELEVEKGLEEGDFPLSSLFRIDLEANDNVVTAEGSLPWILFRLGFTVGYAF